MTSGKENLLKQDIKSINQRANRSIKFYIFCLTKGTINTLGGDIGDTYLIYVYVSHMCIHIYATQRIGVYEM